MAASPYIEVSLETRSRIAEIRRRASAAEGRRVTNEEVVAGLLDAAERERLARVAYAHIRHEYERVTREMEPLESVDRRIARANYAAGLKMALDYLG